MLVLKEIESTHRIVTFAGNLEHGCVGDMCPKHFQEAFLAGTAPTTFCEAHGANNPVTSLFGKIGRLFGRIVR